MTKQTTGKDATNKFVSRHFVKSYIKTILHKRHLRRHGQIAALLAIISSFFLAGCMGEQPPTSDTPGQKAAPVTRDRSTSK